MAVGRHVLLDHVDVDVLVGERAEHRAAIPGRSGTWKIVTFASEASWVTPEMIGCSMFGSSSCTQVPGSQVKLDRTCTGTA